MSEQKSRWVPDTLMLEERAEVALNAMINVADEDYEYIPFFMANFKAKPAYMMHGNWDYGSSHGRLVDSIVLAREMTGSDLGKQVEMRYRENLLSFFREDGLSYRRDTFKHQDLKDYHCTFEESASMIDQRAVLLGLTTWYLATGDERVKGYADRHCAALKEIARKERDSWYYPASEYTTHGWPSFDAVHTRLAVDPCAMWGRQVMPIIRYYEVTGNPDAFELAEKFVHNIIYRSGAFHQDGSFNGALEYRNGHFHTRMGTLASIARFGYVTRDASLIAWVKKSFDWARTKCTTFGWTPGDMHDQAYEHETCTLVDAINTSIWLAKSGYSEYWGVAEKFIRNHLTEAQIMDVSWIEEYDKKDKDIPEYKTFYKVAQRLRGTFAGYAAPNDFVYDGLAGRGHMMDVQTCCVASGVRGLYQGWNNILTWERERLSVNLLLNRTAKEMNINSYLPHQGKVELEIKEGLKELVVRIPEWVPYGAVRVIRQKADGTQKEETGRTLSWVKTYFINLKQAEAGERITLIFPMKERTTIEKAVDNEFVVKWRGDDVIGVSPEGTYYPLYSKRKIYEEVPMREVTYKEGVQSLE
ncbi:hypothetical protein CS063_10160 [Sporanaerobium hydrogeniformans]|uniref:Uncharacterized protein n=1 Tax=Sporanaerobium hydrogeniformans TaxID=3072179 RepID=A0AC61DCJ1_9FIRM|nr:beta-L-arabinofuranosidase domain-containing protein [Sporanaerobium hydrogeniformans]PHV70448.1 hypothetical protein CS063_10160 [Sporanaerobium hydrogeniformans]